MQTGLLRAIAAATGGIVLLAPFLSVNLGGSAAAGLALLVSGGLALLCHADVRRLARQQSPREYALVLMAFGAIEAVQALGIQTGMAVGQDNGAAAAILSVVFALSHLLAALSIAALAKGDLTTGVETVAHATALYVGVNMLAAAVGIEGRAAGEVAVDGLFSTRFRAPWGPGINSFGAISVLGFGAALLVSVRRGAQRISRTARVVNMAAAAVCAAGFVATETRSALVIVVILAVHLVLSVRLQRTLAAAAIVLIVAVPLLFGSGWAGEWLEASLSEETTGAFGRSSNDLFSLGGRADLWQDAIFHPRTGAAAYVVGEPWTNRANEVLFLAVNAGQDIDRLIAAGYGSREGQQHSFHNVAVEAYVRYGLVGVASLSLLIAILFRRAWRLNRSLTPNLRARSSVLLGLLVLLCSLGAFEALIEYRLFWFMVVIVSLCPDLTTDKPSPAIERERNWRIGRDALRPATRSDFARAA